jgi:hypothetical protein
MQVHVDLLADTAFFAACTGGFPITHKVEFSSLTRSADENQTIGLPVHAPVSNDFFFSLPARSTPSKASQLSSSLTTS